jgi:cytochrome c-type biogenesis protein CcmF
LAAISLVHIQAGFLAFSVLSLAGLLLNNAYEYPIVFDAVENPMPWYQKFTGLWSAQGSSLLFWCFLMSLAVLVTARLNRGENEPQRTAFSLLILNITLLIFLIPTVFFANPFEKIWAMQNSTVVNAIFPPEGASLVIPLDGAGMNPALRHIAMLLHPPFLYAGFIGFFIPYAMAMASLLHGNKDQQWIRKTYPIILGAWICLTAGMFLGSWWAYTILGWGGYWGWDAVEISGLLPWLLSFALIHSINIYLKKGIFLRRTYFLSALIVLFILFGILLTRSGIIESVHAYSAGGMGPVLTGLIILHAAAWIFLFIRQQESIRKDHSKKSSIKQDITERLAAAMVWIILALVLVIWAGQTLPVTSRLFSNKQITLDPSHYVMVTSPLFLALIIVTALYPVASLWEKNRRRFWYEAGLAGILAALVPITFSMNHSISTWPQVGFWAVSFLAILWGKKTFGVLTSLVSHKSEKQKPSGFLQSQLSTCLVHLGFAILACGILAVEQLTTHQEVCLETGSQVQVGGMVLTAEAREMVDPHEPLTKNILKMTLTNFDGISRTLTPSLAFYAKQDLLHGQPAIYSNFLYDIYVVMHEWRRVPDGCARLTISILPMINWVWIGGAVMAGGGLAQLFGFKRK